MSILLFSNANDPQLADELQPTTGQAVTEHDPTSVPFARQWAVKMMGFCTHAILLVDCGQVVPGSGAGSRETGLYDLGGYRVAACCMPGLTRGLVLSKSIVTSLDGLETRLGRDYALYKPSEHRAFSTQPPIATALFTSPCDAQSNHHFEILHAMGDQIYSTAKDDTARVLWTNAARMIDGYHSQLLKAHTISLDQPPTDDSVPKVTRVAVIGAGVSGLQVALKLGREHHVDVYEAADRVGGRLFTYKFDDDNEWDYFDVGAMRFPDTSSSTLISYPTIWKRRTLTFYYNGVRIQRKNATGQEFKASVSEGGNVPDEWAKEGYTKLMDITCGRWIRALREDYEKNFPKLLELDEYSTRGVMAFKVWPEERDRDGKIIVEEKKRYPTAVINWLETMTYSAGWFDRAFVETILESYAFAEGQKDVKWRCVRHGSQRITDAMKRKLENDEVYKSKVKILRHHQVTSVDYKRELGELTISGKRRPAANFPGSTSFIAEQKYSHVVLAVSPQVMRYMDLSTCELDYNQRSALLLLSPGPSTKVGIKFKKNWWDELGIKGGQSQTDLPVRTIVYPSYGEGKSTVLIASYCWTQDASTMGALIQGQQTFDEERLKTNILRDLAEVHGKKLADLEDLYEGMFPFDWAHNPTTMGAYAFFGPGQFSSLYSSMTRPAAGLRLHFAGEAISTCHAWVAGALESANRVAAQIDPPKHLANHPDSIEDIPEGHSAQDYPILLGKRHIMLQLSVSNYLQEKQFRSGA
ncbi:Flavin containing amine oxidoreductase [Ceratobasidium sp. AG-Ba]|nr:Flavin containing amine oxidoreductase [Ceratobasidium sp. AG-Ba]